MPAQSRDKPPTWPEARYFILEGMDGLAKDNEKFRERFERIQEALTKLVAHEETCTADRQRLVEKTEAQGKCMNEMKGQLRTIRTVGYVLIFLVSSGGLLGVFWENIFK